MEVSPGRKQTDVGVIPETWGVYRLGDVCLKIQDGTHFSPTIRGGEYLYVTSRNVGFGNLDVTDAERIDAVQHRKIYQRCDPRPGDLLLTKDGASTGNAALNTLDEEFSLLSSVALLRFDPNRHSPAYFLQQILSQAGQRRIKDEMSGNAITRLTLAKINRLKFPVCEFHEQRAIAEVLGDVDALIAGLQRLVAKKRELKQATMQQLLTGQTRLPSFGGAWSTLEFDKVLIRINAKSNQVPTTAYRPSGRFPIVDQGAAPVAGFSDDAARRLRCPEGGVIVFGDHTCLVKFVDFDFLVGADGTQVLTASAGHVTRFLAYHLQWKGIAPTGYSRHFSLLKERLFRVPGLREQAAIAAVLFDMDAELAALEAWREKTRALKQAMMQELLTGSTRLV